MSIESYWETVEPGLLWRCYDYVKKRDVELGSDQRGARVAELFFSDVRAVLSEKKDHIWHRKLIFRPLMSTFEGFIEAQTNGFFDSSDCPPPEIWLSINDNCLVSGVPREHFGLVDFAIDHCVNESLEWAD